MIGVVDFIGEIHTVLYMQRGRNENPISGSFVGPTSFGRDSSPYSLNSSRPQKAETGKSRHAPKNCKITAL